ncbi:MAG: polysulfide reductase NrfD [candidate division NC10 bacterium]|nr:polysulfide reductase NrfD [candidate division NC10 bacterium]
MLKSPDWGFLVDVYFFVGGIAAGAYFTAALTDLLGTERDRPVAKLGYFIALPLVVLCPILLTADLGVPGRTFNMLRIFKFGSPMSVGSWALLGLGFFAALSVAALVLEDRRRRQDPRASLALFRRPVAVLGGLFGFFIASYPGVLLAASNRPLWAATNFLGLLFLAVGASTGIAAIALLLSLRGGDVGESLAKVRRAYTLALVMQILALGLVLWQMSAGSPQALRALALVWSGPYSLQFWGGAVVLGLAAPLAIELGDGLLTGYPRRARGLVVLSALLILLGGYLTKYLVMVAGQA